MKRHNAKCGRCGAKFSILAEETREIVRNDDGNLAIGRMLFGSHHTVLVDVDGFKHLGHPCGGIARICSCGAPLALQPVRGVFRADKKCDGRCLAATGHNCECSCGGKNHGANA